jgi:CubicO group peptidase (beta-lactamase class C family)
MPRPKPVSLVSANSNLDDRARDAVGREAPGVALIVVGPEGIRGDSAVGSADLSTHTPMGTDLVMPWFSMTKIATATTVMRLVEREALELDAPVAPPRAGATVP